MFVEGWLVRVKYLLQARCRVRQWEINVQMKFLIELSDPGVMAGTSKIDFTM